MRCYVFHKTYLQMVRNFRKPLVIGSPKVLLRLPAATSSLSEMSEGTSFQSTIDDHSVDKSSVNKVIFCSGKHYYTLLSERQERAITDTALVRLEVKTIRVFCFMISVFLYAISFLLFLLFKMVITS